MKPLLRLFRSVWDLMIPGTILRVVACASFRFSFDIYLTILGHRIDT